MGDFVKKQGVCIVLSLLLLAGGLLPAGGYACDKQCQKKIARTVKRYAGTVEKAEDKSCRAAGGKSVSATAKKCTKELEALDRQYAGFTDEIKSLQDVRELHQRHLALRECLGELTAKAQLEKLVKAFERRVKNLEKHHCGKGGSYRAAACDTALAHAGESYAAIPADHRKTPAVVALKSRLDALALAYRNKLEAGQESKETAAEKRDLIRRYRNEIGEIRYSLAALKNGKLNRPVLSEAHIRKVREDMPAITSFGGHCGSLYAELADDDDVREKCELARNAQQYLDQLVLATRIKEWDHAVKTLSDAVERLENDHYIESVYFDRLTHHYSAYCGDLKKRVAEAYAACGQSPPPLDALASLKPDFDAALAKALTENRWDRSGQRSVSGALADLAGRNAKEKGLALSAVVQSPEPWRIVKNKYGTPLRMENGGFVLLQHPDESFVRVHRAVFKRVFNGTGYEPASAVEINTRMRPTAIKHLNMEKEE